MPERFEYRPNEYLHLNKDFIVEELDLIITPDNHELLDLKSDSSLFTLEKRESAKEIVTSPDQLYPYFENYKAIQADSIRRSEKGSTLFTTAGIQHIETILEKEEKKLDEQSFTISQPSVRSQYMDKTKEGTSTSFVNFCIADIQTSPQQFVAITKQYLTMLVSEGADPKEISFTYEDSDDIWGDKKINKTTLTILYKNIELGESVYIHDYPLESGKKISMTDVSFGIERLNWVLKKSSNYLHDFAQFYSDNMTKEKKDTTTSIIDCIRTATLLAGEGVIPSHKNPGRTLRQLMTRFAIRNREKHFTIPEFVNAATDYWQKWGFRPSISNETIITTLEKEYNRALNVRISALLKEKGGPTLSMDVNQDFESFINTLRSSSTSEVRSIIEDILKEII
jgi:hypothetical protein